MLATAGCNSAMIYSCVAGFHSLSFPDYTACVWSIGYYGDLCCDKNMVLEISKPGICLYLCALWSFRINPS